MAQALPATYQDGSLVYAGQDLSIPTAASNGSPQSFTTEGFTLRRGSKWTVQNNSAARPSKQLGIPEVPEADVELTFAGSNTAEPYQFSEFSATDQNSVTRTFVVAEVVVSSKNDGSVTKCTIKARWKLN